MGGWRVHLWVDGWMDERLRTVPLICGDCAGATRGCQRGTRLEVKARVAVAAFIRVIKPALRIRDAFLLTLRWGIATSVDLLTLWTKFASC